MSAMSPGCEQFGFKTIRYSYDFYRFVRVTYAVRRLRFSSSLLASAWENAQCIDWWAQEGFYSAQDAADAWSVAADVAEEHNANKRRKEARILEKSWRDFIGPQPLLLEGPILPWPEVKRFYTYKVYKPGKNGRGMATEKFPSPPAYGKFGRGRIIRATLQVGNAVQELPIRGDGTFQVGDEIVLQVDNNGQRAVEVTAAVTLEES